MWKLDYKESWVPKNWCFWTVVLEKTLESPLDCKEIQPAHPKGDQSWVFTGKDWCGSRNSNTLATWCEELTPLKRPWCWVRLRARGKGDDRGLDSWMTSPTRWTWVWVNSRSWWWTGKPGVMQSMGLQRVGHDWATELNWTDENYMESTNVFMATKCVQKGLFVNACSTFFESLHISKLNLFLSKVLFCFHCPLNCS